jgi:hypothetical protein
MDDVVHQEPALPPCCLRACGQIRKQREVGIRSEVGNPQPVVHRTTAFDL